MQGEIVRIQADFDAMEPDIRPGDIMHIMKSRIPEDGCIILCTVDGEPYVRLYTEDEKGINLTPINMESYKPKHIAREDIAARFRMCGIIETISKNYYYSKDIFSLSEAVNCY